MLLTRQELGEVAALRILEAARAKAAEMGVPQCIAVVDRGGRLLAFCRMDGAKFHSTDSAMAKAVTAASIRAPTGAAPNEFAVQLGLAAQGKFTNLLGGLPVVVDGDTVGAIGVGSGKPDEDVAVAEAGIAALGG